MESPSSRLVDFSHRSTRKRTEFATCAVVLPIKWDTRCRDAWQWSFVNVGVFRSCTRSVLAARLGCSPHEALNTSGGVFLESRFSLSQIATTVRGNGGPCACQVMAATFAQRFRMANISMCECKNERRQTQPCARHCIYYAFCKRSSIPNCNHHKTEHCMCR